MTITDKGRYSRGARLLPATVQSTRIMGRCIVTVPETGMNLGGHPTHKEAAAWAAGWNAAIDIQKELIGRLEDEVEASKLPHLCFFGLWRMGGQAAMLADFGLLDPANIISSEVIAAFLGETRVNDEQHFFSYVLGASESGLWLHRATVEGAIGPWNPQPIDPADIFDPAHEFPPYLVMQAVLAWLEETYGWPQLREWESAASLQAYEIQRDKEDAAAAEREERTRTVVLPEIVKRLEAPNEWCRYDTAEASVDDAVKDQAPFEAAKLLRKYLPKPKKKAAT